MLDRYEFDERMKQNRLAEITKIRRAFRWKRGELYDAIRTADSLRAHKTEIRTIGVFCHRMFSGGSSRVTSEQLLALTEAGFRVVLFANRENREIEYPVPESVIRVMLPYDDGETPNYFRLRAKALDKALETYQIDVFLYNLSVASELFFDGMVIKTRGIPLVAVSHLRFSWIMMRGISGMENRLAGMRLCDKLLVLSRSEAQLLHEMGVNAAYLCNPIDRRFFSPGHKKGSYIVWVGRMSENEKNPSEAIRILAEVKKSIPDVKLKLYGEATDEQREKLLALIGELGLTENAELCGFCKEIRSAYEGASIFLMTSSGEAFPMTICESKLCGVPLVMYDLPYLEILTDREAYMGVPWGNQAAAAEKIVQLLSDDDLYDRYSKKAYESIEPFRQVSYGEELIRELRSVWDSEKVEASDLGTMIRSVMVEYDRGASVNRNRIKEERKAWEKERAALLKEIEDLKRESGREI